MRRSEVLSWLQSGNPPGQKGQAVIVDHQIPNPKYKGEGFKGIEGIKELTAKKVTWTRMDGETLEVIDYGRRNEEAVATDFIPNEDGTKTYDPDYEVVGGKPKEPKEPAADNRTDEDKRNEAKLDLQRRQNEQNTGYWETDSERRNRERQEAADARQAAADEDRNAIERDRLEISRRAEDRASTAESRQAAAQAAADARAASQEERDNRRLTLEEDRYDFDREKANRPTIVGTPGEDDEQIAMFDPSSGKVVAQDNPLFNRMKAESKRKSEELTLAIQATKITQEEAATAYTRWFQENVELPYKQSAERRAQATETRQAQEAEERKRQFAVTSSENRAKIGVDAANMMVDAETAMLPYRAGPKFGEQFSSAINGLAAGGKMTTNAASGVNFTADAFEFKRPDLDSIARKAMKSALKGVTKYDPDAGEAYAVADYSDINLTPDMSTMPTAPEGPDINAMFQDWQQNRYIPGQRTAPPVAP